MMQFPIKKEGKEPYGYFFAPKVDFFLKIYAELSKKTMAFVHMICYNTGVAVRRR